MQLKLGTNNHFLIHQLIEKVGQEGDKNVDLDIARDFKHLPRFSKITQLFYFVLDQELYFGIWLKNIPFCVVNFNSRDHVIFDKNYRGEKSPQCKICFYRKLCGGFPRGYFGKYGKSELKPTKDLPCEVMIEVESRCNFNCQFCFNKISFAKKNRNIKSFSTSYIKKIIDGIAKAGIKIIRFTGGEPMLRNDIFELMQHAKKRGLEVRLNTNGSLINAITAKKLKGIVDNVLLPIESYRHQKEKSITGKTDSLSQKIRAIKLLKKVKIPIVRVGTIALKENILNLERFAKFIFNLPINEWELYRPISGKGSASAITRKDVNLLVDKLINIKKKTGKTVFIANALPFCSISNLNKINSASQGALFDDGHKRIVVDPRGFVKPHYFLDRNIGNPLDILGAWNHPFMKRMRNLEYLPKKCVSCRFKFKCRGGSRYEAKMGYRSYRAIDPLARPKNKFKIKRYNLTKL